MVLDEGYSVNLDVVDLGSKLHAFVLLASDYGTDIGTVYADNAVLNLHFFQWQLCIDAPEFTDCKTLPIFLHEIELGKWQCCRNIYDVDKQLVAY